MSASSSSTSTTTGSIMSITSTLNSMNLKENPTSVTATVQKKENVSQTSLTIPIIYLVVDSSKSCAQQCTQVAKGQADCARHHDQQLDCAAPPARHWRHCGVHVDHCSIGTQDCICFVVNDRLFIDRHCVRLKKKKKKIFQISNRYIGRFVRRGCIFDAIVHRNQAIVLLNDGPLITLTLANRSARASLAAFTWLARRRANSLSPSRCFSKRSCKRPALSISFVARSKFNPTCGSFFYNGCKKIFFLQT
jgi:hypothetical protein